MLFAAQVDDLDILGPERLIQKGSGSLFCEDARRRHCGVAGRAVVHVIAGLDNTAGVGGATTREELSVLFGALHNIKLLIKGHRKSSGLVVLSLGPEHGCQDRHGN